MLQHRKRNYQFINYIHISNVYVRGCKNGIVAHGAEGMVHNITIKDTYIFYNQKAQDIDETCKIKLEKCELRYFCKVRNHITNHSL